MEWNELSTKLNEIKKSVQPIRFPVNTTRKERSLSTVLALRMVQTRLTYTHI